MFSIRGQCVGFLSTKIAHTFPGYRFRNLIPTICLSLRSSNTIP